MSRPKRNNEGVPITVYEQHRLEQIETINQKLDALNLPRLNTSAQNVQPSKRTKRTQQPSDIATEGHNLRTRSQINRAENANEQNEDPDYQPTEDCNNEGLHNSPPKKRKGRGITLMEDIFARTPSRPKIKIIFNEFGQPVGDNSRQLSSAIGCQVRKTISVACSDWRLVDIEKKFEVWDALKKIYDIDDDAFNWFLVTAARKWKKFKATLKAQFFDEKVTSEELQRKHGDRVKDTDWDFLVQHWSSPEFEARMEISKANRAKLGIHHTSGSKSFARSRHEMGAELGRLPRRDEIYIKTHTRKNGVYSQQAEPIINKHKSVVEARPELVERSIQQGDVLAAACGEKEPRGRVRALGLGPTPQDVGTPGLKCYKPTRLQMEVVARKKAESDKATLERRIQELQEELQEARIQQERRNIDITSQNGSNSRNHMSPRSEGQDEAHLAQPYEDDLFEENNENYDHNDEDEYLLCSRSPHAPPVQRADSLSVQRAAILSAQRAAAPSVQRAAAPSMQPPHPSLQRVVAQSTQLAPAPSLQHAPASSVQSVVAPSTQRAPAPSMQCVPGASIEPHLECSATSPIKSVVPPKKKSAPRVPANELVGKEVTLFSLLRPEPVAKGLVISTNPTRVLGGQPLGNLFCEVAVNLVLKRDIVLPRPYGYIQKMADAKSVSVAWPYNRLRVSKASNPSQSTAAGEVRRGHSTH